MGLSAPMIEALEKKGFDEPTPIQALTIPRLLSGEKDVIGQAQTGTGKTAAFGIPILEKLAEHTGKGGAPRALILSPTRELSMQIATEMASLRGDRKLRIGVFYGGQPIGIQLKELSAGVDIAIGTPGRIIDLMERNRLPLEQVQFAVLDEADEMLDMGFIEDIENILSRTPADRRMLMFSATMPHTVLSIAARFMREYEVVRSEGGELTHERTEQVWFDLRREDKLEALSRIIDLEESLYGIVFCHTRGDVDELSEQLGKRGYAVAPLHGDIPQTQRTRTIDSFKRGSFKLLIATDVAARGIDVNNLTHVINFSMPNNEDIYVHRIGRTGRAGKSGKAITFVTPGERKRFTGLCKKLNLNILKKTLPAPNEIVAAAKGRFAKRILAAVEAGKHEVYLDFAGELLETASSHTALVGALIRALAGDSLTPERYRDLCSSARREGRSGASRDDEPAEKMVGVKLGVGYDDGVNKRIMMDMIFKKTGIQTRVLGKVDCHDSYTFLNAVPSDAMKIERAFRDECGVTIYEDTPDFASAPRAPRAGRPERQDRPRKPFQKSFREFRGEGNRERPPRGDKKYYGKKTSR